MEFNDLLKMAGIEPETCAVMLHSPSDRAQRRGLLSMAQDEPQLFEAYQDNHPKNAEATLKRRAIAASFVVEDGDEARFVGLYCILGSKFQTSAELDANLVRRDLQVRFRDATFTNIEGPEGGRSIFDLQPLDTLSDLRGRLIVRRTPGRAYMRLAENNKLDVIKISRKAAFVPPAPDWHGFILTAPELRVLPHSWAARLREWRGVYLIVDSVDGARYVGSAYNETNLLGRWMAHVAGDTGVTAELAHRDPTNFRFSILELLAPSADKELVIALENRWKQTIGTRQWGLNRN